MIRDELDRAKEEIVLAIYDLTMRTLCRALERAHQRGVKVRILFDRTQVAGRFSKYRYLQKRGIGCRIERLEGVFHHQVLRHRPEPGPDGLLQLDGLGPKFRNQENLVWISEPGIAEGFSRKFEELWEASQEGPPG